MRMPLALGAAATTLAAALLWTGAGSGTGHAASKASTDIAAGAQLYAEFCAACHGANLEGQANWRSPGEDGLMPAPPHDETGHTWHHSDQLLFAYTKLGGKALMAQRGMTFESGMPGFGDQMTDDHIHDVLAFIKSTWPARIQATQAERTKAETQQD